MNRYDVLVHRKGRVCIGVSVMNLREANELFVRYSDEKTKVEIILIEIDTVETASQTIDQVLKGTLK